MVLVWPDDDGSENGLSGPRRIVISVSSDQAHRFSKPARPSIRLIEGLGVEGDAHAGRTVQHRWSAKRRGPVENQRQVHLIHRELFDELRACGIHVRPGELGENITTQGVDLLSLPLGSLIRFGDSAAVEVTGVRTPCAYLDRFQNGLKRLMIGKDAQGRRFYKAGIMAVVRANGPVAPGDAISIALPPSPWLPLPPL
jgi:MOSC domain-containing protein YiiM